ncbi:MAG: glutaredoxin domain-containing protein [Patescibacteria group bacterium]|nr:glutaredoxin domain-containing protein [Patescibacteria group bacterium]
MTKVIIYTTPSCVYCKVAKTFFTDKKIEYVEKDVATDLKAQEEMIKKSGQFGIPVIDIDGEIVIGFDKSRLIELLKLN